MKRETFTSYVQRFPRERIHTLAAVFLYQRMWVSHRLALVRAIWNRVERLESAGRR